MKNVTIKDIAKHAGVSIATVSRVVNQNYKVSIKTRECVQKSIDELGYVQNSVARSLKVLSTFTIGLVVSDIGNAYFTAVAKALEDTIRSEKYNLIVCSTEGKREKEKEYLNLLISKKVDGLVINTTGKNDDFIAEISRRIPMVLINRKIINERFMGDFVDSNNFEGGYDLAKHLLEYGHKKIGIINGEMILSTAKERFEGVKMAFSDYGISMNESYYFDGDFTRNTGEEGAKYLLGLKNRPTAIIAMNNAIGIGFLKYIVNNQIDIPDDVSFAVYGNIENSELFFTRPSHVTLNPMYVGAKAGQVLIERIANLEITNREIIFSAKFIGGSSVKKVE
jgi:LacI family transcriptional regulator